jgi:3-oxoacyl-[acyl-carrier protein] reductase
MREKTRNILISGGSKGLGEGIVDYLLSETKHNVATFSRNKTPFIRKCEKKYGKRFLYEEIDLNQTRAVETFVAKVQKTWKTIDALINNAGVAGEGVLPIFPDQDIDRIIDINLKSTIRLTRAVSRLMLQQKSGSIMNISSILGMRGYNGLSVYSASKAGLIGFTQSLARELGRRSIRVNAIAPGYFETEMSATLSAGQKDQIIRRTPLGRLGTIRDIVPLVHYLISDDSAFITGHTFVIDGGVSC